MIFAEIILPLALPKTLTYGIPETLQGTVRRGMRVEVSFGKNKSYAGIVYELHHRHPESYQVKPVKKLLDQQPIVSERQLAFWTWISRYYCCTLGDVMQAALPAHLKLMNETMLIWNEQIFGLPQALSDEGYLLAEALQVRKKLTIAEIRLVVDNKNHARAISEVLEYGLAFIEDDLKEKYKPKEEQFVYLSNTLAADEKLLGPVFDSLKTAPRQSELLLHFFQIRQKEKEVSSAELLKLSGAKPAALKALVQKGILETCDKTISRLSNSGSRGRHSPAYTLNEEQEKALQAIRRQWSDKKEVVLLQGVTGSGKTMLYIRLILEAIERGQATLFLLPEIALTTHFVQRLFAYFGDQLGVYHSRFSNNERVEIWNKVQNGQYKVIIGARSALWLPFQNLAQIIVDEEHEISYKQQDPAPRFQARDASIFLAGLHQAKVLLGSATPSLESAYNVQTGKYGFAALHRRFHNQVLPEVKTIPAGNIKPSLSGIITLPLLNAAQNAFSKGKQVLLFQNKRGYAPFLICASCGFIPHCPQCDVSLTYHKVSDRLHCHYCGQKSLPLKSCPQCGQAKIIARSFGTEKIEEDLQRIFPKRRIARMDTDSVRGKNAMSRMIRDFERGSIDMLVGTQMIVKGLDFENVGLVGILNADSLWSFPDFRVNERAFQLMEQVSGRAGRTHDDPGEVYIQAYNLQHPLLQLVAAHDYRQFYRQEIQFRAQFDYPPFSKLIKLTLKHRDQLKAAAAAGFLAEQLQHVPRVHIQGPAPAVVSKIRNLYLFEIRLKLPKSGAALSSQKQEILTAIQRLQGLKGFSGVQVIIDIDPW
ncbi:MAG TPA: primosomal protein N' [Edaphocola sp.]|nr:primosomal protein N' [Edaphocola sp.]